MKLATKLPPDHPVVLGQLFRGCKAMRSKQCPRILVKGKGRTFAAAIECNAYRQTPTGIHCGMHYLGDVRVCPRKMEEK